MHCFNCFFVNRKQSKMPCTSCMTEYGRKRKEHGCSKCGFGFCEKCLGYKCAIPSISSKPVPVCYNCYHLLNKKDTNDPITRDKSKSRDLPLPGENKSEFWGNGELPPPSLRSLYPKATASKRIESSSAGYAKSENEWAELEARLQRLNEPIDVKTSLPSDQNQKQKMDHKNNSGDGVIDNLEERLAALKGVPVDVIRKPRLLVMNEEDNDDDLMTGSDPQELIRQAESRIKIGQNDGNASNRLRVENQYDGSTSSINTEDSSADSSIIRKTINEVTTANSSTSDLSSQVASEQLYPNFAECIKKTMEEAAIAEKEAIEFLHRHGQSMNAHPEIPPHQQYNTQMPTSNQQNVDQLKTKGKIKRFFL